VLRKWLTYSIIIALFSLQQNSYAQNINIDSLWIVWNDHSLPDTIRLKSIHEISSKVYLYRNLDSAHSIAQIEYDFAKSKENIKYMAVALKTQGTSSWLKGNYSSAMDYLIRSKVLFEKTENQKEIASVLNIIGLVYKRQADYVNALDYYNKSMNIAKKTEDKELISKILNNIGIIYKIQNDYVNALDYYEQSLTIKKEIGNQNGVSAALNNIGQIYKVQKDYAKALDYYMQSLSIKKEIGSKNGIANALNNIGTIYHIQGDYINALDYFTQCLSIKKEIGTKYDIALSLNNVGIIYKAQGDYTNAIKYGLSSLNIGKEIGSLLVTQEATKALYEVYKTTNRNKLSLEMYELYIVTKDSIEKQEIKKELMRLEFKNEYNNRKVIDSLSFVKQKELNALKYEADVDKVESQRNKLYGVLLSLFALGVVVFRAYKIKKKDNQLINEQKVQLIMKNQALVNKNNEKTTMLKEIHHRVKNNLQVVNSLLKFQSREIEDENILAMFKDAQNRVLSMALLHEKMYKSEDIKHIDVQEHFSLLVEDLVKTYAVKKNIDVDVSISDVDIGLRTLVPLGLIINEMITNSLKHAFKNKKQGIIKVHIKPYSDNFYEMIIGDNGIGLKENQKSTGLGTKLIQIFTKQLNATIEKLNDTGTVYKLIFEKID